jgi:hypothetical protein
MASAPSEGTPTLELRGVSKALGSVIALGSRGLTLYPSSIHALPGTSSTSASVIGTCSASVGSGTESRFSTHPFNRKSRSI